MKSVRHSKILEIIEKYDVETQEELITRLRDAGFDVTQATVSRDIRELKLTKVMSGDGNYKYVLHKLEKRDNIPDYKTTLSSSVLSVESACNIVVIKTYPGMAQAVAAILDGFHVKGAMGCVAGDDTIFVCVRDESMALNAALEIKKLCEK